MKNFYAFLLVVFSASIGHAQIVDIPNPAFKTELLTQSTPIDTNGDGEIQVSEAQARTSLSLNLCTLDNTIGIQAFTNLEDLHFSSYCDIASPVDLSGMTSIKSLQFHKCSIPSVNVAGMTGLEAINWGYTGTEILNLQQAVNLKSLYFYDGSPNTMDLSGLVNLTDFYANDGNFESINLDGLVSLLNFTMISNNNTLAGLDLSDLTNLKILHVSNAQLTEIDFQNNVLLEELFITNNNFSTFDISMLPNLTSLTCRSNHLAALDVSNNTNLTGISCDSNNLAALDVSMLPNLTSLYCNENNLTTLNVANNAGLTILSCADNQLTTIDFTNLHQLKNVNVSNNLFTTLDFSGLTGFIPLSDVIGYQMSNNPNLVSINMKNGKPDFIQASEFNCPNLIYICADESDVSTLNTFIWQHELDNIQVNTYCSFVPGGNYNTITGTLSMDLDNNGCDANDLPFASTKLTLTATNQDGIVYSNADGVYNFYTQSGEFLVTPEFENPYFNFSPASATVNFADTNNNTQTQNFCITPNGVHNDVEITLIPVQNARPGFDATYQLVYTNKGNQMLSGSIDLTFDNAVLDFVFANPNTDSQSLNQLHWDYSNLSPFEKRTIDFTLNVNSPQETPAVNNGDVLPFSASITPVTGDETVADNTVSFSQTVLGSFDPNDKICLEGSRILPEMVGDYLHYVIRFQNSGTAAAENIVVKDMIDTSKFDLSTLQLTASSHPQVTRITGNKVEFIFENINLPTEGDNEAASHGYIAFKIKTNPNLALNDVVENTADIFFDYNFPIATNTASSTISQLGLGEVENHSVSMAPNPVRNILTVSAKETITSILLFDIQGRLLQSKGNNENTGTIDFTGKTNGVYFVKAYTDKGMIVKKVIKE